MAGIGDIVAGVASVVGIRLTPEPPSTRLARPAPGIEIRRYAARVVYEAPMPNRDPGRAFNRLFRTIAGGNAAAARIAMTAPVETGPRDAEGGWAMRFFLPEDQLAAPPRADDPGVRLRAVPAATYAVFRFGGSATAARLAEAEAALRRMLVGSPWRAAGPALVWLYDPPFTPAPLRRNEVAVPVTPAG